MELVVVGKQGPDVAARCLEKGLILSRANLTFRWGGGEGGEGAGLGEGELEEGGHGAWVWRAVR